METRYLCDAVGAGADASARLMPFILCACAPSSPSAGGHAARERVLAVCVGRLPPPAAPRKVVASLSAYRVREDFAQTSNQIRFFCAAIDWCTESSERPCSAPPHLARAGPGDSTGRLRYTRPNRTHLRLVRTSSSRAERSPQSAARPPGAWLGLQGACHVSGAGGAPTAE